MLSERFLQNSGTDEYDPDVPPAVGPQRLQYSLTSPEQRREDHKNPLPNALHSSHGSPREMEVIGGRPYEAEAKPPSAAEQRFEKLRSKLDAIGSREGKTRPSEPFATPSGSNEPSPSAPNQKILNPSKSEPINVVEANHNVVAPTIAQKQIIIAGNPLQPKSVSSTGNTVRRVPLMYDKVYIEDSKNCAFEVQIMERWKVSPPRLEKNAPFLMSHPPVLLDPSISKDVNNGFERPVKVPPRREGSPQLLEPIPQPQNADDDEKKVGLLDRFRLAVQRMQVKSELCSTSNRFRFFFPELASPAASINKNQRPASSTNPSQDFWLGEFQCVSIHNNRPHEGHVIVTDKHLCFLGHLRRETFVVRSISPLSSIICIEECTTETDKNKKTAEIETPQNRNVVKDSDINTKGKIFNPIQQRGDSVLPDALQIYFDNGTVLQLFDIKNKLFKRIPTQRPSLVDGKAISTEEPSKQQEFYFGRLSGEIGMHQTFLRDATDLDRFEGLLEHAWRSQIGM